MKGLLAKLRDLQGKADADSLSGYGIIIACGALALMMALVTWRSGRY